MTAASSSELCNNAVACVDALASKITVQDSQPTLHRLQVGDIPGSSTGSFGIATFLEDMQDQLAKWHEITDRIEDAFQRLKKKRDALKRTVDVTIALLSPVRRLPEDVLVEIFSIYIGSSTPGWPLPNGYSLALNRSSELPDNCISCPTMRLSQICSFWRKIILRRPRLWASLAVKVDIFDARPGYLNILSHYLSCSKNTPLKLRITSEKYSSQMEKGLKLLIGQSARWKDALIGVGEDVVSRQLLMRTSRDMNFPNLKHIRIRPSAYDHGIHYCAMLFRFRNLLTLDGGSLPICWREFRSCDFTQLKEFRGGRLSGASIGQFLSRMPALNECSLERLERHEYDLSDDEAEVSDELSNSDSGNGHCHLNLLTLSVSVAGFRAGTWTDVQLPNLRVLELRTGPMRHSNSENWLPRFSTIVEEVSSMLLRSKTILRKVKLTSILADDAISVIESHPSISELTISGCYDRDYYTEKLGDLFSRLTVASKTPKFTEDTNNVFAPHVQFLNLELYTRTKASVQTFVEDICELVESRSAAKLSGISPSDHRVFPLRRVRLQADLLYADRAQVVEAYRIIGTRLKPLEASGLFVSPKLRDEIDGTVRHFRVG